MKREILMYNKVVMNPNPLDSTLTDVAVLLDKGHTVSVELEPGDCTRYELVLVPMWSQLVDIANYGREDQESGLAVIRLTGGDVKSAGIILLNRRYHADIDRVAMDNAWTKTFFRWWFQLLYEEILEQRRTNSDHTFESVRVDRVKKGRKIVEVEVPAEQNAPSGAPTESA